jgi:hypothetical protein
MQGMALPRTTRRAAVTALAIAATALQCVFAASATAAAIGIVKAAPLSPGEHDIGRGPSPRVTFSPDHDGVRDTVAITASAPAHQRVSAVIYVVRQRRIFLEAATSAASASATGRARLTWDGTSFHGHKLTDGSYLAAVCPASVAASLPAARSVADNTDPDAPVEAPARMSGVALKSLPAGCSSDHVQIHLRVLSAWITSEDSYAPGAEVPVRVTGDAASVQLGIYADNDPLHDKGAALTTVHHLGKMTFRVPTDTAPGEYRLGVASATATRWLPLVVRDGSHPLGRPAAGTTLVVMPYLTWRAYNEFDADRDGLPDTWYKDWSHKWVTRIGPYEYPGRPLDGRVPQGTEQTWLMSKDLTNLYHRFAATFKLPAQFITDEEFAQLPQSAIDRYRAVIYPAHSEYYLQADYDRVRAFEQHGRFAYLSANGFFALVSEQGGKEHLDVRPDRTAKQSDYGLIGVGFDSCCWARHHTPGWFHVTQQGLSQAPWMFFSTGYSVGEKLMMAGGEVDTTSPTLTPPGTVTLDQAAWTTSKGKHSTAESVWFRRPSGGEVFAAGNMKFTLDAAHNGKLAAAFQGLWQHLVR